MLSFTFLYASFWRRLAAFLIDVVLLSLVSGILFQPFLDFLGFREMSEPGKAMPFSLVVIRTYGLWALLTLIGSWLYFALQESSVHQATIGKRIRGIMVFTDQEERISFRVASLRFWSKFISLSIALLGFIMAAFDPKRRALHDIFA